MLQPHRAGLAVGLFLASFHLVWSALVALGVAQAFLDFVFDLHMLMPAYTVNEFSWVKSLGLILFTFAFGYLYGWGIAMIWNRVVKGK